MEQQGEMELRLDLIIPKILVNSTSGPMHEPAYMISSDSTTETFDCQLPEAPKMTSRLLTSMPLMYPYGPERTDITPSTNIPPRVISMDSIRSYSSNSSIYSAKSEECLSVASSSITSSDGYFSDSPTSIRGSRVSNPLWRPTIHDHIDALAARPKPKRKRASKIMDRVSKCSMHYDPDSNQVNDDCCSKEDTRILPGNRCMDKQYAHRMDTINLGEYHRNGTNSTKNDMSSSQCPDLNSTDCKGSGNSYQQQTKNITEDFLELLFGCPSKVEPETIITSL